MGSFASIPTIKDLRTVNGAISPAVAVLSFSKQGDGGGGIFSWDPTASDAEDGGLVFTSNTPAVSGRWKRKHSQVLNVRWFGAQGDGLNDDYVAIQAAIKAINARKGGTLLFPPGVYRIDRFKIASGTNANGPNATGWDDLIYRDCDGLDVIGYGAVIDVKGNFNRSADHVLKTTTEKEVTKDPATGKTTTVLTEIKVWETFESAIQPFVFMNCSNVRVEGFEIRGNVEEMSRDYAYFYQGGSGITFGCGCSDYTLSNLYVHSFANDGIYLGLSAVPGSIHYQCAVKTSCDQRAFLFNVKSNLNARDGISLISLRGGVLADSQFSENGRAKGPYGADPSNVGIDIEPSFTTTLVPGDLTFTRCESVDNGLAALSASAESCSFHDCLFWGTEYYSVVAAARSLVFEHCTLYGACSNRFLDHSEMPEYTDCHFEDKEYAPTGKVYRTDPPFGACIGSNRSNVRLLRCSVVANKTRGVHFPLSSASDMTIRHSISNSTILHRFSALLTKAEEPQDPHGHQSQIVNATLDDVHFKEDILFPRGEGWFIDAQLEQITTKVQVDGPYVTWKAPLGKTGTIT
jgi:hypothetical protein